jgi:hypothetical protein
MCVYPYHGDRCQLEGERARNAHNQCVPVFAVDQTKKTIAMTGTGYLQLNGDTFMK